MSRVVVHFADPDGHPVDFRGEASVEGEKWTALFDEHDYQDRHRYEKAFTPTDVRHFRLTITRSSSPRWPDAAQLSEIELLP